MHLAESASLKLKIIPVVHEVIAVMAAEAFNATSQTGEKSFALVTAGPGISNSVTGIAGAFLEAREVLVIGGQVKVADLSDGSVRQMGIQEIDGISLTSSICIKSSRMKSPWGSNELRDFVTLDPKARPGPIFLEIPIDVQGAEFSMDHDPLAPERVVSGSNEAQPGKFLEASGMMKNSMRPILLIGGGVSYEDSRKIAGELSAANIPIMTTWNGADRVDNFLPHYMGRPNTWGQRYSNMLIQQSDLVIAIGTRLGLQQTGFNWEAFAPTAKIIQVDIDEGELAKSRPNKALTIQCDGGQALVEFLARGRLINSTDWSDWSKFCQEVKAELPLSEDCNLNFPGFWNPYEFFTRVSRELSDGDRLIPSSSGSSFTVGYQAAMLRPGVRMLSSKSLASMGNGLGTALGAALTSSGTTVLVEGDGGFAQNMQDLGTLARVGHNVKIFIWDNGGYGSIRTTQKSYFDGHYVGCDAETGLHLPNWEQIARAFSIPFCNLEPDEDLGEIISRGGVEMFRIRIHPDQTFYPKITSRVLSDGGMESNPLHLMYPPLRDQTFAKVWKNWNR